MNFVKQIFEGKIDANMHHKFIRYGRGEYERLYFELTRTKKNLKVKSSYDFANDFVKLISENIKEDMEVKGKIIVNHDFENELKEIGIEAANYSKRGKLYTAELDATLKPEQLKQVCEKFDKNFLLLTINSKNFKLKTKNSLPKPGGKVKPNFCSATLPLELADEFAWDVKDLTKVNIRHIIKIDDIIVPEELKNDLARARLEGKRKGKLIRILDTDGKEEKKEVSFEA